MSRKFIKAYQALGTFCRIFALLVVIVSGRFTLPGTAYAVSALLGTAGIYVFIKSMLGKATTADYTAFFAAETLLVIFNLFYTSLNSFIKPGLLELVLVGTLPSVMLAGTLAVFIFKSAANAREDESERIAG